MSLKLYKISARVEKEGAARGVSIIFDLPSIDNKTAREAARVLIENDFPSVRILVIRAKSLGPWAGNE